MSKEYINYYLTLNKVRSDEMKVKTFDLFLLCLQSCAGPLCKKYFSSLGKYVCLFPYSVLDEDAYLW